MANINKLVLLIISMIAMAQLREAKDGKQINIGFYLQDTVSGDDPSAIRITQPPITSKYPSKFGAINMQDDPLTQGPDPKSKLIGRSQGFYGYAAKSEVTLFMALTFVFTDGLYKGSSVNVIGRNVAFALQREIPIVGGTGAFRLARGMAVLKTYKFNNTTRDATVHYNLTIVL